jgi:ligand-binding SRPBCC domain-containing protein
MRTFILRREQWIPRPVAEVCAFFADANNLEAITPPWLRLRILSPLPILMRPGASIIYRLSWRLLRVRWITEITEWVPPARFVDVQRAGPYAFWHHTHEFEPCNGGTKMFDTVRYGLPLGPLGTVAHRLIVRRDLAAIFDYRMKQVQELLGCGTDTMSPLGVRTIASFK